MVQLLALSIDVSCLLAGPVQACANGTVTYLGNCSTSSVIPGQLYYAGTVSEVNPCCHFASTYQCIPQLLTRRSSALQLTVYGSRPRPSSL